jgi:hypothetical protein
VIVRYSPVYVLVHDLSGMYDTDHTIQSYKDPVFMALMWSSLLIPMINENQAKGHFRDLSRGNKLVTTIYESVSILCVYCTEFPEAYKQTVA